ncbi:LytR/AlgR family response regulator transcription factor [Pedobacter sp. MC2016-24]|uniref:LytR/AlgR family response regulator transcription factor n=1 Tax=Pedobacter sp. MC2016-24 TaxID=2780090 RepID=UPI00351C72C6
MPTYCIAIGKDIQILKLLNECISLTPNYQLLGCFTSIAEASEKIELTEVIDVLFVDTFMCITSDSSLAHLASQKVKSIILTTTYIHCAFRSQFYNHSDLCIASSTILNSPFTLKERLSAELFEYGASNKKKDFFFVKVKGHNCLARINIKDIVAVECRKNYLEIFTIHKSITTHITLSELKRQLMYYSYITQVHRSFLISLDYLIHIDNNVITMVGNLKISLSTNYRKQLLSYIKLNTIN